jgi:hypothetical protein
MRRTTSSTHHGIQIRAGADCTLRSRAYPLLEDHTLDVFMLRSLQLGEQEKTGSP